MDFFRSIISDDPPPPVVSNESQPTSIRQDHRSDSDSDHTSSPHDHPNSNPAEPEDGASGWSFGGFVRTFTTRSESVLETYRRDLEEFRSGLKKETELFKEVASRAVKDLPSSIEVGASAAHGSLEAVGRTLDGVLKSTAEIMSQGKETLLASSDVESDTPDTHTSRPSFDSLRYNRFEAQLRAIQSDANTYSEEPDDLDDYSKWKLGFVLEDKSDEIKNLIEENGTIEGIYKRLVPGEVDNASFWSRYFYRFHKLKQQEDMRANLVKRAIAIDDEEELSWDVDDDDDDDEETNAKAGSNALESKENKELSNSDSTQSVYKEIKEVGNNDSPEIMKKLSPNEEEPKALISKEVSEDGEKPNVAREKVQDSEVKENELVSKPDEKVDSDKKDGNGDSSKDGDVSVVSTKPVVSEEEEVGWDEIEDLGALENKVSHSESTNRAEVRKQINTTEEEDDEDLSWDIEDDDEPVNDKK